MKLGGSTALSASTHVDFSLRVVAPRTSGSFDENCGGVAGSEIMPYLEGVLGDLL